PDSTWHNADVTLTCHYTDSGSGPAMQDVTLSTSVATNTETDHAGASAHGAQACDAVGNCAVSPSNILGNKIDKKAPSISIVAPANTSYLLGQSVTANYVCSDGGSGVASCVGTVTHGANIDTSAVGAQTFTVNATDQVGNATSTSVAYDVVYSVIYNFS